MASPFPITLYCNFNCLCHEHHHSFDTAEILPTSSWSARIWRFCPYIWGYAATSRRCARRRSYAWKTQTWTNHHSVLRSSRLAQLSHAFLDEYGATSVEEHPRPYIVDEAWNSRYYARQEVSIPENWRSMTRPRRVRAKVHSTNSRFRRGKVPVACYLRRATRDG
jgi:hypothetical protein